MHQIKLLFFFKCQLHLKQKNWLSPTNPTSLIEQSSIDFFIKEYLKTMHIKPKNSHSKFPIANILRTSKLKYIQIHSNTLLIKQTWKHQIHLRKCIKNIVFFLREKSLFLVNIKSIKILNSNNKIEKFTTTTKTAKKKQLHIESFNIRMFLNFENKSIFFSMIGM